MFANRKTCNDRKHPKYEHTLPTYVDYPYILHTQQHRKKIMKMDLGRLKTWNITLSLITLREF